MENPLLQKKNLLQSNTNYNKLVKAVSKETAFFLKPKSKNNGYLFMIMLALPFFNIYINYSYHNLESLFFRFD